MLRANAAATMRHQLDPQWERDLAAARNQPSRPNPLDDIFPVELPPTTPLIYYNETYTLPANLLDDETAATAATAAATLGHTAPVYFYDGQPIYEDYLLRDDTMSDDSNNQNPYRVPSLAYTATAQDMLYSELVAPAWRTSYDGPPDPHNQLTIEEAIELMRPCSTQAARTSKRRCDCDPHPTSASSRPKPRRTRSMISWTR
jgi:hypothetical protein